MIGSIPSALTGRGVSRRTNFGRTCFFSETHSNGFGNVFVEVKEVEVVVKIGDVMDSFSVQLYSGSGRLNPDEGTGRR